MPLLGSYGGSSEYAYRGTIDDWPDDFSITNLTNVIPGGVYTSETITVTGINNRAVVSVSAGSSVSINGGPFTFTSEESPIFVKNNETITVSVPTTSGSTSDFNKTYSSNVKIGKKSRIWTVSTKTIDQFPNPFVFTNLTNKEVGIAYTSNEITVSGLENDFTFLASIISGSGQISINGGSFVSSGNIVNGDRIYLRLNSPFEYSNYPSGSGTRSNVTTIQVGDYTTNWSVSSRDVDIFIDPFEFNDVNNAVLSAVYTAQSVNNSGVITSISGADQGIPLVTAVSGCELRVEQPAIGGGWSIRSDFSPQNTIVFNGDRLTARISAGSTYSETKVGIVTVSSQTARFIVTTRPRPIDTIPDSFSGQFNDLSNQPRNTLVESNEITLVGMTDFGDEGVASIRSGGTGGNPQFQVTRGGSIVRSFSSSNFNVRNNDKIKLRITTSNDSNGTVNATFRVDGIDTNLVISGQSAFQDDIWTVSSLPRVCDINSFTLFPIDNANIFTQYSRTFTVSEFESDCGMIVSTSNPNSSLSVAGQSGNNLSVSPGSSVTVFMTSGNYSESTSTTITVSNSSSAITPSRTYSTTWTINSVADTRNTVVSLSANPTSVLSGGAVTLTWSSVNADSVTSYSGSGFFPSATSGSTTVFPTTDQTYSISMIGPPSAGNYPQQITATASVSMIEDTTPDSFSLNPSSYTNQNTSSTVTFTAQSSANSSVSVTGLTSGTFITASVTANSSVYITVNGVNRGSTASVQNNDVIVVYLTNSSSAGTTVSGSLTIGSITQSFSSATTSCTVTTDKLTLTNGVNVQGKGAIVTYRNGSVATETGSNSLYTNSGGNNLNSLATSPTPSTGPTPGTLTYSGTVSHGGGSGSVPVSWSGPSASLSAGGKITGTPTNPGACAPTTTTYRYYRVNFPTSFNNTNYSASFSVRSPYRRAGGGNLITAGVVNTNKRTSSCELWWCGTWNDVDSGKTESALTWIENWSINISGSVPGTPGTPGTPGVTWNSLINTITSAYTSSYFRPAKLSEIQSWASAFRQGSYGGSSNDLNTLSSSISNAATRSTRASSYTDQCGGTF